MPGRTPSGDERARHVAAALLAASDYLGPLLTVAGAVGLAFGAGNLWVFIPGIVLAIAGVAVSSKGVPAYRRLEEECARMRDQSAGRTRNLHGILDGVLRTTMELLPLVDFSQSRISVYRHDDSGFAFLGRVSRSTSLAQPGRRRCPESEGIIGRAWDVGWASIKDLPASRDDWDKECARRCGMDIGVVRALRMQSRSVVGIRLDKNPSAQQPAGVLVIESLRRAGVDGGTIDELKKLVLKPPVPSLLAQVVLALNDDAASTPEHGR